MNEQEQKHHPYSPSSFPAWAQCPHWESGDTKAMREAANLGTRQHELLAKVMNGDVRIDDVDEDNDVLIPVRRAYFDLNNLIAEEFPNSMADDLLIETEKRVGEGTGFPTGTYGTGDIFVSVRMDTARPSIDADHILVVDYKSHFTNKTYWEQLAFYAWAYAKDIPGVKYATLAIYYGDEGTLETLRVTPDRAYAMALHAIANRLNRDDMPRTASAWCALCKMCGKCPEAFRLIQKAKDILPSEPDGNLAPGLLPSMLDVSGEVKKRIAALEDYARKVADENGGVIKDGTGRERYALKEVRFSNMKIQQFFDAVRRFVPAGDVLGACKLTKSGAKALLKGRVDENGNALTTKRVNEIVESACEPAPSGWRMTKL